MTDTDIVRDLGRKLDESLPAFDKLDRYYDGNQALALIAPEVRQAAPRLFNVTVNLARLAVDAVAERIDVEGFTVAGGVDPDPTLWAIWEANDLPEASAQAHLEALVLGRAYLLVWAGPDGMPRVTVESPRQLYVAHDPASRQATAAVKRWVEDGHARATLYLPDRVVRMRSRSRVVEYAGIPADGWIVVESLPNPLGEVPVATLVNRGRLLDVDGVSDLADLIPLLDAIGKLQTDMLVSSEFHSLPRRWATGLQLPEDENGEPDTAAAFAMTAGRVWMAEDPETSFGQFREADLSGFLDAITLVQRQVAALASLPLHYIAEPKDQPASADAIRSSEASLASKARRKQRAFGAGWARAMRLAIAVQTGRPAGQVEVSWRNPETRTIAQAADAAVKLVQAGILPPTAALESLGYTPTEIERIRVQRRAAAIDAVIAGSLS